jgi:hypothetical protein
MSITRIVPHMYLFTPLGPAEAHFIWGSDTFEVSVTYCCFQCETKENWFWPNTLVRLCESITALRDDSHSPIYVSDALFETLRPHILRHKKSPLYERAAAKSAA